MEISLPDVSNKFQKTQEFLTQTLENTLDVTSEATAQAKTSLSETATTFNQGVNSFNQALGTVAEKTETAKNSLSEVASQAATTLNETTTKALTAVSRSAETAKESLAQTTNQAVNTLNQTTSQALDSVAQASAQAQASLADSIHQAENISGAASDALKNAINGMVLEFMAAHPLLFWLVSHPLILLLIICLFILSILGIFQAFSSLFKEGFLGILKIPGTVIKGLFNLGYKSVSQAGGVTINKLISGNQPLETDSALGVSGTASISVDSQERLADIVRRLETIRQEQSQLLQEASAILGRQL